MRSQRLYEIVFVRGTVAPDIFALWDPTPVAEEFNKD